MIVTSTSKSPLVFKIIPPTNRVPFDVPIISETRESSNELFLFCRLTFYINNNS